jgi:esterase/lipase superfamily enzyme
MGFSGAHLSELSLMQKVPGQKYRMEWHSTLFCLLLLILAVPVEAQQPTRLPQAQAMQPISQPIHLDRQAQATTQPHVSIEPIQCLPLGDNGVVAARVTNEPLAAQLRIYFRRVNANHPDFYYVKAHAEGGGIHRALLPRPAITGKKQEPVELYAAMVDHLDQEVARSSLEIATVTDTCPRSLPPAPGEALNLTIGETTPFQGEEPPFHFECTGIVTREYSGRLFQDAVCRDYFVPYEPRVQTVLLRSQTIGSAMFRNVTIFYGTDRQRTGSIQPVEFYLGDRGPLEVGTCEVTIPASHQVGELESAGTFEKPDPEKHIILLTVTPMSEAGFASGLAARVESDNAREALVFIHGYNVSFEDAARRTAQMAADLQFDGAPVMYSWPSQASIGGYPVDEANIRWTVPHLQRFLNLIVERSGASKVHLIAHSMGNRAVTEVLLRYATAAALKPGTSPQLNQVILVAPDVDADVFRDEIAPRIHSISERISLYASANDKALKVSKGVHGHPRAGDLSSGILITGGVETIDASNVDTSLFNAIALGHSYFAEQPTIIDDLRLLLKGRSPEKRGLTERKDGGSIYWEVVPHGADTTE